jgi:hypothetical protein
LTLPWESAGPRDSVADWAWAVVVRRSAATAMWANFFMRGGMKESGRAICVIPTLDDDETVVEDGASPVVAVREEEVSEVVGIGAEYFRGR